MYRMLRRMAVAAIVVMLVIGFGPPAQADTPFLGSVPPGALPPGDAVFQVHESFSSSPPFEPNGATYWTEQGNSYAVGGAEFNTALPPGLLGPGEMIFEVFEHFDPVTGDLDGAIFFSNRGHSFATGGAPFPGSVAPGAMGPNQHAVAVFPTCGDFECFFDPDGAIFVTNRGKVHSVGEAPSVPSLPGGHLADGETVFDAELGFDSTTFEIEGVRMFTNRGNNFALGGATFLGSIPPGVVPAGHNVVERITAFDPTAFEENGVYYFTDQGGQYSIQRPGAASAPPFLGAIPPGTLADGEVIFNATSGFDPLTFADEGAIFFSDRGNSYAVGGAPFPGSIPPGVLGPDQQVIQVTFDGSVADPTGVWFFTDTGNNYGVTAP